MSHKRKAPGAAPAIKENVSGATETDGVSDEDSFTGAQSKEAHRLRQMLLTWNGFAGRNGDMRLSGGGGGGSEGGGGEGGGGAGAADDGSPSPAAGLWAAYHGALGLKKPREQSSPSLEGRGGAADAASVHDETSSSGNKEDEDDDDDADDDKIDSQQYDPERLKAFNMFVRLFVDENLDRMVPISKQPKEKVQAIIDSCARQFPEFAERARKRIRTYLKSCRRNKRSRDANGGWDAARPTPAHLTSVQAEQILAQACENEAHNAKRMRLGLEPVAQPMPLLPATDPPPPAARPSPLDHYASPPAPAAPETRLTLTTTVKTEPLPPEPAPATPVSAPVSTSAPAPFAAKTAASINGSPATPSSVYRPNFSQAFQRVSTGAYAGPVFAGSPFGSGGVLSNGPTDLSMKTKPLLSHKLNTAEMAAVRQLITGYRESAAFLLRSADELEQLLLQQQ